jgi:hypothetical protein
VIKDHVRPTRNHQPWEVKLKRSFNLPYPFKVFAPVSYVTAHESLCGFAHLTMCGLARRWQNEVLIEEPLDLGRRRWTATALRLLRNFAQDVVNGLPIPQFRGYRWLEAERRSQTIREAARLKAS